MEYRSVGNRCAVNLTSLRLSIPEDETLSILSRKGFRTIFVDMVDLARSCVGVSEYRRGSRLYEAPQFFDCSSFVKYLYSKRGIWLPRRSIQQRSFGEVVELGDVVSGDLVFVSSWIDYYDKDPADGVGHVGIATGQGTVIHAANKKVGVIETPIGDFVADGFRGVRRSIRDSSKVLTLETPDGREVETSDDIRWIVLQSVR